MRGTWDRLPVVFVRGEGESPALTALYKKLQGSKSHPLTPGDCCCQGLEVRSLFLCHPLLSANDPHWSTRGWFHSKPRAWAHTEDQIGEAQQNSSISWWLRVDDILVSNGVDLLGRPRPLWALLWGCTLQPTFLGRDEFVLGLLDHIVR